MPTTYAIPDGRTVMAATLWTGTGATQSITNTVNGVSFQPDFVWNKSRSTTYSNEVTDSVRGTTQQLYTNLTDAEYTASNQLTSFNSNGFTISTGNNINASGQTYVGWQWNAGGSTVTNTSGSISAQVRANTTAGFSVVTFTAPGGSAQTIGHGLGVAPRMIIIKSRNNVSGWNTYHASVGNTGALNLQTTGATSTSVDWWNNTSPTSTVWTIGANINISTWTFVAYCFAPVAGYSAFGSYTGNGSTDGVFVYLGFRARFLMIKSTSTGGWVMLDTSRDPYNDVDNYLYANSSAANAGSSNVLDINSNGFKIRNSWTDINGSGTTYIYMAFCENPLKFANAR
jgi:hypothetical protein